MSAGPIDANHAQTAIATIQLVGELGADRVTVANVTKHLGITRAAMKRQCETEEELWRITIGFITHHMSESWNNRIRGNLPPKERLQSLLTSQIELITGTPALRDILFSRRLKQNHTVISHELRNATTRFQQLLADIVAEGKAAGDFSDELDPDIVAREIMELLQAVVMSWSLALKSDIVLDEIWARLDALLGCAVKQQNTSLDCDEMASRHDNRSLKWK